MRPPRYLLTRYPPPSSPLPFPLPITSLHHKQPLVAMIVEKTRFRAFKKMGYGRTNGRTDGPTDGRTDGRTDRRTDRPSYRDARTHLKTLHFVGSGSVIGSKSGIEIHRFIHRLYTVDSISLFVGGGSHISKAFGSRNLVLCMFFFLVGCLTSLLIFYGCI